MDTHTDWRQQPAAAAANSSSQQSAAGTVGIHPTAAEELTSVRVTKRGYESPLKVIRPGRAREGRLGLARTRVLLMALPVRMLHDGNDSHCHGAPLSTGPRDFGTMASLLCWVKAFWARPILQRHCWPRIEMKQPHMVTPLWRTDSASLMQRGCLGCCRRAAEDSAAAACCIAEELASTRLGRLQQ
jgi:hypothetical protein